MARRSRDLAGLAALGALGYMALRGDKQAPAPVEDRSRYVNRAGDAVTSDLAMGEPDYSAELAEYRRRVSPAASMPTPEADAATDARVMSAAERSGLDVSPGERAAMSGSAVRPAMAAPARAARSRPAASARLASPDADFPSGGRTMPLRQQLTQTTLGKPTGPAPNAPSIYAGPEAFREYRQQQAAERAAQPPTQQGSARNIVQRMREKDKAVLAAVRRRQAEEEAVAQAARDAASERRREARRVEPPAVGLDNPYYGRSGAQRATALRAKGGAIKAKPKKMASGGMTSASKRADGIATKGKTKCKMY